MFLEKLGVLLKLTHPDEFKVGVLESVEIQYPFTPLLSVDLKVNVTEVLVVDDAPPFMETTRRHV